MKRCKKQEEKLFEEGHTQRHNILSRIGCSQQGVCKQGVCKVLKRISC